MRFFLAFLSLICVNLSFAQTPADDESNYQAAIEWLNRKLNYTYYDPENGNWWVNTFYANENKEITLKNISAKNPKSVNVKNKVYNIRKFQIQDINPDNIIITDVKENQGRIVKGKLMQLHTFSSQKKIAKTIDGRRASNTSFLFISFPEFLTDSLADYHLLVKENMIKAIINTTRVYTPDSKEETRALIFKILNGTFKAEDGQQLKIRKHYSNVLSLQQEEGIDNYFGFDEEKNQYYTLRLANSGVILKYFKTIPRDKITLQNIEDSNDLIVFETLHSFKMQGVSYHRK